MQQEGRKEKRDAVHMCLKVANGHEYERHNKRLGKKKLDDTFEVDNCGSSWSSTLYSLKLAVSSMPETYSL